MLLTAANEERGLPMRTMFLFVTMDDTEITNDMYTGTDKRGFRLCSESVRRQCPAGSRVDLYAARYDDEGINIANDFIATICQR